MFTCLQGGYNTRHPRTFFNSRPQGSDHFLLLLVRTQTAFCIDGHSFAAESGSIVLIQPNTPYRYHGTGSEYSDDWLSFLCPDPEAFRNSGIDFHMSIPIGNPDMSSSYIRQILLEKSCISEEYRNQNIHMLFCVLFNNLRLACMKKARDRLCSPYFSKMQNLRLSLASEPYREYTPALLAGQMGISASYFQHLYTEFFHISLRSDLIRMRIEYAKGLLQNTDMSIEDIAEASGYSSKIHFYRQFRRIAGTTPSVYRSSFYQ